MKNMMPLMSGLLLMSSLQAQALELFSDDIRNQERMKRQQEYRGYGCDGQNTSPALRWKDIPSGTKSFALTVHDPDAPRKGGWWHWVVFNIPRDVRSLEANAGNPETGRMPEGTIQSRTDFGKPGYGGPCPPKGHGIHHYPFTLYALDVEKLPLDETAPPVKVDAMIRQHTIGSSTITGLYSR